jgi:transposase
MVTLSMKEQKRVTVVVRFEAGLLRGAEAAEAVGLSLRQFRRVVAAYRKEGVAGLAHGNRGRPSCRAVDPQVREEILRLAGARYQDYNDVQFTEKLEEKHGIRVSRSTLRRLRRSIGQGSPRKRRPPLHRSRRDRRAQEGMLLQLDGSPHAWLEDRGPELSLLAAIDDATGKVPFALFREEEDTAGYFELVYRISLTHGLPLEVYSDQHTIFRSPKTKSLSIAQKLEGARAESQFQRLMRELCIEQTPSLSPQGRGRVERLWGTLQDRLVKELREANARTKEDANQVLEAYLPKFNARFGVPAREATSAYLPWPEEFDREEFFCLKHRRTVQNDNTISFGGHYLQIPPGPDRVSYARARVDVYQRLDGCVEILYKGKSLVVHEPANPDEPIRVGKFTPAEAYRPPEESSTTQTRSDQPKTARPPYKPAPDHPWRRPFLASKRNTNSG